MKKLTLFLTVLLCFGILFSACQADEADPSVHLNGTNPPETQETEAPTQETEATVPPTQATEITEPPTEPPTQPTEQMQPPTEPPTELPTQPTDPETGLPVYVPGSLELMDRDTGDSTPENRQYRFIYYNMWGEFSSLAENKDAELRAGWVEYRNQVTQNGTNYSEMRLVSFIKYYDISREEFEEAVEKYIANHTVEQLKTEYYEVPNADIIYTFDNEIINEYYRYE